MIHKYCKMKTGEVLAVVRDDHESATMDVIPVQECSKFEQCIHDVVVRTVRYLDVLITSQDKTELEQCIIRRDNG